MELCRICLKQGTKRLINWDAAATLDNKSYLELYEYLIGQETSILGPKQLCLKCAKNVKNGYEFKKSCLEAESFHENTTIVKKELDLEVPEQIIIEESYQAIDQFDDEGVKYSINDPIEAEVSIKLEETIDFPIQQQSPANNYEPPASLKKQRICVSSYALDTFECPYCKKIFKSNIKLRKHCIDEHPNDVLQCADCPKKFHLVTSLRRHRWQMHDLSVCCHCGKTVISRYLTRHIQDVHTRPNMYFCDLCGAKFHNRGIITEHMRLKHLKIPFKCKYCSDTFKTDGAKRKHQLKYHLLLFKHSCTLCPKNFVTARELKSHMTVHTGERNFKCDICGIRVSTKYTLNRHKAVHSDQRPFVCEICSMSYKTSKALYVHKRIHNERSYECPVCNQKYISNQQMRLHCSKVHPEFQLPPPGTIMNKNAIQKNQEKNEKYNVNYELAIRMPKLDVKDEADENLYVMS